MKVFSQLVNFQDGTRAESAKQSPGTPKRDILTASLVTLLYLISSPVIEYFSAYFITHDYHLPDEGMTLTAGYLVSLGKIPHIDFTCYYAGGLELLLGLLFSLVGTSFGAARLVLACCFALIAGMSYMLHRMIGVGAFISACVSLVSTILISVAYYHIHPGWVSIVPTLFGILVLASNSETPSPWRILTAGICAGIACSIKQTVGVFAIAGFALYLNFFSSPRVERTQNSADKHSGRNLIETMRARWTIAVPLSMMLFLFWFIRAKFSPVNFMMLLILPGTFIWTALVVTYGRFKLETTRAYERALLILAVGFLSGFSPILIYFISVGAFWNFLAESFLRVQVLVRGADNWTFLLPDALANYSILARRLLLHLVPLGAIFIGLYVLLGKKILDTGNLNRRLLVLNSIVLSFLHLTLYPICGTVYILYLAPLLILPYSFLFQQAMRWEGFGRGAKFIGAILASFLILGAVWQQTTSARQNASVPGNDIVKLEGKGLNLYLPRKIADRYLPVIQYLDRRPRDESFVALDRYNSFLAFATGREIPIDYSLTTYTSGQRGPGAIDNLEEEIQQKKISIVIIPKEYREASEDNRELTEYVRQRFGVDLETQAFLVFRRNNPD